MRPPRPIHRAAVLATAAALLASACAAAEGGAEPAAADAAPATDASASAADTADAVFPMTVVNCDRDVVFERPPERIAVLARAGVLSIIDQLDELDRVIVRAGAFPEDYYDDETNATIATIPSLGEELDDAGHLQISQEAILEADPDLVIGLPDGIDRDGLERAGIPLLRQPANCPEGLSDHSFEVMLEQVELYGQLLDVAPRAAEVVAALRERIVTVEQAAAGVGDGRTAAALFPIVGGGSPFAYGNVSMPHLLLETAGFTNVFADVDERVFEVTHEELIDRDPDVLVLLHVDGEPGPVEEAVRSLPGADGIAAVADDRIEVLLFNFGEYPTPLLIDGLERIVGAFGDDA